MKRKQEQGFTIIELIVVMGVISVLATVLITIINPIAQFAKSRDGKRKADLEQMRAALEEYRADQGSYFTPPGSQAYLVACGNSFSTGSTTYIQNMPCDPLGSGQLYNSQNYAYGVNPTGSSYAAVACLENANDSQGLTKAQLTAQIPSGIVIPMINCTTFYLVVNP